MRQVEGQIPGQINMVVIKEEHQDKVVDGV
jgi:hypothetical protein